MTEVVNNKERAPREYYEAIYQKLDPHEISSRCAVSFDGAFRLNIMGAPFRAGYPAFSLKAMDGRGAFVQNFGPSGILVLRYLTGGRLIPALGGMRSYAEMPWGEVYSRNFNGRCITRLAFAFGRDLKSFEHTMESLGAKRAQGGDAAYDFEFMDGLIMRFIIWEADDEFAPSAQILFSDNFPAAMSAEDMAVAGDIAIGAAISAAKSL